MRLSFLPVSLVLPLAFLLPQAIAQESQNATFIEAFLNELTSRGFNQLANVTMVINQTTVGQQLLSRLSNLTFTIFAPTDAACKCLACL